MAHEPRATVVGQLVGMGAEQGCNLGLDGLRHQRSGAVAQNLGQRIGKWMYDGPAIRDEIASELRAILSSGKTSSARVAAFLE
jgi:hypothetical protein